MINSSSSNSHQTETKSLMGQAPLRGNLIILDLLNLRIKSLQERLTLRISKYKYHQISRFHTLLYQDKEISFNRAWIIQWLQLQSILITDRDSQTSLNITVFHQGQFFPKLMVRHLYNSNRCIPIPRTLEAQIRQNFSTKKHTLFTGVQLESIVHPMAIQDLEGSHYNRGWMSQASPNLSPHSITLIVLAHIKTMQLLQHNMMKKDLFSLMSLHSQWVIVLMQLDMKKMLMQQTSTIL